MWVSRGGFEVQRLDAQRGVRGGDTADSSRWHHRGMRRGEGIDSHFLRRGGGRRNTAVLVLPQGPGQHHQAPRRKLARWRPQALWGDLRLPACLPGGASLQAFMFEARGPLKPRNDRPVPQPALPVAVARSSPTC